MDDDTEAETFQPLWVDWTERIISFHQEAGYERLEFSSNEEKWHMSLKRLPMVSVSNDLPVCWKVS